MAPVWSVVPSLALVSRVPGSLLEMPPKGTVSVGCSRDSLLLGRAYCPPLESGWGGSSSSQEWPAMRVLGQRVHGMLLGTEG